MRPRLDATFGSLDDFKKKYPKRETNEAAKRPEQLTSGTVFDLTPVVGSVEPEEMRRSNEWNRSQSMFEFLMAQVARPEVSIDPPPEEAIRFLEEKRGNVDALESVLVAGPPPEWTLDLSVPENDRRKPNSLGQVRVELVSLRSARAGRLVVDAELTSKILQAKSLRRENGGRWPAAIPGIETSRFPGASWRYEASPDGGGMSIAFSRALASPEGWKRSLPLRFSSN